MKKTIVFAVALCLSLGAMAQKLEKPVRIKSGGEFIDLSRNAAPVFYDFDKDGKKDLIVGGLRGALRFYRNVGAKNEPKYNGYTNIKAGGEDIKMPNY